MTTLVMNTQLDMTTPLGPRSLSTSESCNQMGTVFEEMSSWACFNKTSRGEDNILDKYIKFNLIMIISFFMSFLKITNIKLALEPIFWVPFCSEQCISSFTLDINKVIHRGAPLLKIYIIKIIKYSLFHNAVFIPEWHVNAVHDDIPARTVPIRLHHSVIIQGFDRPLILLLLALKIWILHHIKSYWFAR